MTIKEYLKALEKKGIISKNPSPIIPYIITIIFLLLIPLSKNLSDSFTALLYSLFIVSAIFSFLHFIINKILVSE